MTSFKRTEVIQYSKSEKTSTPDGLYWKNLDVRNLVKKLCHGYISQELLFSSQWQWKSSAPSILLNSHLPALIILLFAAQLKYYNISFSQGFKKIKDAYHDSRCKSMIQ